MGLPDRAISLTVRAASILVGVRIQVSDLPTAQTIITELSQPTAAAALSAALGITIESVATPVLDLFTVYAPFAPPVPPPAPPTNTTLGLGERGDHEARILVISLGVAFASLTCLLLALCCARRRTRSRRVVVDYSPSPGLRHQDVNELSRAHANRIVDQPPACSVHGGSPAVSYGKSNPLHAARATPLAVSMLPDEPSTPQVNGRLQRSPPPLDTPMSASTDASGTSVRTHPHAQHVEPDTLQAIRDVAERMNCMAAGLSLSALEDAAACVRSASDGYLAHGADPVDADEQETQSRAAGECDPAHALHTSCSMGALQPPAHRSAPRPPISAFRAARAEQILHRQAPLLRDSTLRRAPPCADAMAQMDASEAAYSAGRSLPKIGASVARTQSAPTTLRSVW